MSIRVEVRIPPPLGRDGKFWSEIERLAGSKSILFREEYSHSEKKLTISAVAEDDPTRIGVATIEDSEWHCSYPWGEGYEDREKKVDLLKEAFRFAAWQLIHWGEEDEEDAEC